MENKDKIQYQIRREKDGSVVLFMREYNQRVFGNWYNWCWSEKEGHSDCCDQYRTSLKLEKNRVKASLILGWYLAKHAYILNNEKADCESNYKLAMKFSFNI